ncbi:MAG: DUF2807 domain-containing protein [Terrimonas sp.]|nr:DUF2807 domain-containing protein [Terrimonas sp.]
MKKIIFYTIIVLMTATGCRGVFGKRIRGNGNVTTQTRSLSGFNKIDVGGAIKVYVKQDSNSSVKVETDENLITYVETTIENGTLHIHEANGVNLKSSRGVKVYVSGPEFTYFEASGACNIYSENQINASGKISVDLSGACDIEMDVKAPQIEAELSGAGTIKLKGETKDFEVRGSGSTDVKCFDLLTENTTVEISGAGDAQVSASVKLDVHVSGAGSVRYKGNPSVTQDVSGAGSVKKVD